MTSYGGRATFGPIQAEITAFTGKTATQAVQTRIVNINCNPPPPVDLDSTKPGVGQPYLQTSSMPLVNICLSTATIRLGMDCL